MLLLLEKIIRRFKKPAILPGQAKALCSISDSNLVTLLNLQALAVLYAADNRLLAANHRGKFLLLHLKELFSYSLECVHALLCQLNLINAIIAATINTKTTTAIGAGTMTSGNGYSLI